MLVIHLQGPRTVNPANDGLERAEIGWHPGMSTHDLYEAGRGCWRLNATRSRKEDTALFVAKGVVRGAMAIDRTQKAKDRYILAGCMLAAGDPVYDTYVGHPSPVAPQRNPIRYWSEPSSM